jgi:N-carbamoylputrescine amidase
MADAPFRIGLTQLAVDDDRERTIVRHEDAIREAAGQGARIICMQELFDAPYFCKVQDAERFDLAEPMPGPVVVRMQRIAKELETVCRRGARKGKDPRRRTSGHRPRLWR